MDNSSDTCSICLEDTSDTCLLNCNHSFCKKCIDDYLKRNNKKCPNCRTDISSYSYNNTDYQLIFMNEDNQNEDIIILRNQLNIFSRANRKLVTYGYITLSSFFYLTYNYLILFNDNNLKQSKNDNLKISLDNCHINETELYNILDDQSYNVIVYNPYYNDARKCFISEYSYDKCFEQNIYQ